MVEVSGLLRRHWLVHSELCSIQLLLDIRGCVRVVVGVWRGVHEAAGGRHAFARLCWQATRSRIIDSAMTEIHALVHE